MPLTLKQLTELRDILNWALGKVMADSLYVRVCINKELIDKEIELTKNSNRNEQQAKKEENK